ncbi:MAG: lysophospholipid acyltransferase family protein [Alphaproteobacteria bacterium]
MLFNVAFFGWTFVYGTVALPFVLTPRVMALAIERLWTRSAMALVRTIAGIDFEIRGREFLPQRPVILAVKHQSAFETLALPLILDDPLFVVKRELFWIPFFGWYLARLGNIGIDRSAGPSALKAIVREAKAALAAGHSVIIFPEGTRVTPGKTRPYGPGVAALYGLLDAPVVPVALNSGLFWGRRRFGKRPGTATIEFLAPIAPGLDRHQFLAELQNRIEAATARLIAETTGA